MPKGQCIGASEKRAARKPPERDVTVTPSPAKTTHEIAAAKGLPSVP